MTASDMPSASTEPGACPSCGARLMKFRGWTLDLDRCVACAGIWFDRGELDAYRATHAVEHDDAHEWRASDNGATPIRCPRCRTWTVATGTALGAPAMQCRSCHGIFISARLVTTLEDIRPPYASAPPRERAPGSAILDGAADLTTVGVLDVIVSLFDF